MTDFTYLSDLIGKHHTESVALLRAMVTDLVLSTVRQHVTEPFRSIIVQPYNRGVSIYLTKNEPPYETPLGPAYKCYPLYVLDIDIWGAPFEAAMQSLVALYADWGRWLPNHIEFMTGEGIWEWQPEVTL